MTERKSSKRKTDDEEKMKVSINTSDLKCPVCTEIMIEPLLYPCSHRVCKSCTKEMFYSSAIAKRCPICRVGVSERVLENVDTFMSNITRQAPITMACGKVMTMEEYDNHEKTCLTCSQNAIARLRAEKQRERGRVTTNGASTTSGSGRGSSVNLFGQPGAFVEYYTSGAGGVSGDDEAIETQNMLMNLFDIFGSRRR